MCAHSCVSTPVAAVLLVEVVLVTARPARLRGGRVITVTACRQGLCIRVITVALGRRGIVPVTLRLWAAVVTVALRFRLRVMVRDGGQSFLLDIPICLTEAGFSLMERTQL